MFSEINPRLKIFDCFEIVIQLQIIKMPRDNTRLNILTNFLRIDI